MKITILIYGLRGDVQPFIPRSLGLMTRGHSVRLAAPSRFKELVEGCGIQSVPLAGEPEELSRRFNDAGEQLHKNDSRDDGICDGNCSGYLASGGIIL